MSSFATYLLGFVILIFGLAVAAFLLNIPMLWIVAGVIALGGIIFGLATNRPKSKATKLGPPPPGPSKRR